MVATPPWGGRFQKLLFSEPGELILALYLSTLSKYSGVRLEMWCEARNGAKLERTARLNVSEVQRAPAAATAVQTATTQAGFGGPTSVEVWREAQKGGVRLEMV